MITVNAHQRSCPPRCCRLTEVQGVASVRPYIMDLGSVNGTWLNRERIEPERYLQLLEQASCCPAGMCE